MSRLSWALVAGLIACGGYVIGAHAKDSGSSSSIPGLPAGLKLPGGLGAGLPAGFDPLSILGTGGAKSNNAQLAAASSSAGRVILVSKGKVYVKMADGTTKAVQISSGTSVAKAASGSVDDIKVGDSVLVDGRVEKSGVIAANTVIVEPPIVEPPTADRQSAPSVAK